MSCNHDSEQLSAYLDGELESRLVAEVEQRVQSCSFCGEALASLERVSRALELPEAPDEGFLARLEHRRRDERRTISTWRRLAIALVPAAALVLFVAGFLIGRSMVIDESTALAELEAIELGDAAEIELPAGLADQDRVLYIAVGAMSPFVDEEPGDIERTSPDGLSGREP